ncbi:MFS transporter [Halorubellus sp. JP-L1]|uniref:MFS transporter n=1 Tax=Halorubellus sp. JP-L1 TaxID=2715753 RepID=UPI00140DC94A|nr:MFS transporter [Halorubellus sp. JP-L1]NHN41880.1 MFS transporter [Halorubellus sp. JP-L1]
MKFGRLVLGNISVSLGWWFSFVTLSSRFVFEDGISALPVAGITIIGLLPTVVVSPLSGVLADRVDRRQLMVVTQVLSAVVAASFLVLESLPTLYLAFFCLALFAEVFKPAQRAMVTELVASSRLLRANVVLKLTSMVAPGIAGVALAAFSRELLLGTVAALYVGTAIVLLGLPTSTVDADPSTRFSAGFLNGLRQFSTAPVLLLVTAVSTLGYGTIDAYKTLLPLYVRDVLLLDQATYGVLTAVTSFGAVAGGLAMSHYEESITETVALTLTLPVAGASFLALVVAQTLPVAVAASAVLGIAVAIVVSCGTTVVQRYGGTEFTGRLIGLYRSINKIGQIVAMAVMGALSSATGIARLFFGAGTVLVATGLVALVVIYRQQGVFDVDSAVTQNAD